MLDIMPWLMYRSTSRLGRLGRVGTYGGTEVRCCEADNQCKMYGLLAFSL